MRSKSVILALAVAVATGCAQRLSAQQAAGFAGTWAVEYPSRIMNENGMESVEMGHARMTLQQSGDSLSGEWRSLDPGPDGKPAPSRTLHGTVSGTHASLEATGVARVNRGGEESAVHVTIHYELEVAGDDVSGTQRATLSDGSALGSSRKITGKRETAAPAKS